MKWLIISVILMDFYFHANCQSIKFAVVYTTSFANKPSTNYNIDSKDLNINNHSLFQSPDNIDDLLLDIGFRSSYLNGHLLKQKYLSLLSSDYSPLEVFSRAMEYDAIILSGYSLLQGLYFNQTPSSLSEKQRKAAHPTINHNYGDFNPEEVLEAIPLVKSLVPLHSYSRSNPKYNFLYNKSCLINNEAGEIKQKALRRFISLFKHEYNHKLVSKIPDFDEKRYEVESLYNLFHSYKLDYLNGHIEDGSSPYKGIDLHEKSNEFFNIYYLSYMKASSTQLFYASEFLNEALFWMSNKIRLLSENKRDPIGYKSPNLSVINIDKESIMYLLGYVLKATKLEFTENFPFSLNWNLSLELYQKVLLDSARKVNESDFEVKFMFNDYAIYVMDFLDFKTELKKININDSDYLLCSEPSADNYSFTNYVNYMSKYIKYRLISILLISLFYFILLLSLVYLCYEIFTSYKRYKSRNDSKLQDQYKECAYKDREIELIDERHQLNEITEIEKVLDENIDTLI